MIHAFLDREKVIFEADRSSIINSHRMRRMSKLQGEIRLTNKGTKQITIQSPILCRTSKMHNQARLTITPHAQYFECQNVHSAAISLEAL